MNETSNSSASTMLQNPLYLEFKDAGFQLKLFAPALVYAMLASVGIPLNFSVCYITFKYRSEYQALGSPTGILIAMNSFFELLHQSSHFCFLAVAASGTNFIPAWLAFRWQCLAILGFIGTTNLFSLSVDRLFAVAAPIRYRNMHKRAYICLHLLFMCLYVAVLAHYEIHMVQQAPEWPVTGYISDVFFISGQNSPVRTIGSIFACLCLTILCYLLVALLVKCRAKEIATANIRHNNANESLRRLYRSLALIVGINVSSYLLAAVIFFALEVFIDITGWTAYDTWLCMVLTGLLINVSAIANAPILITNSSEYNAAYRREWQSMRRWICPNRIAEGNMNTNQSAAAVIRMMQVLPATSQKY